jgi:menaquinol-cytochrome c reductase iron-sulfur subunit
MKSPDTSSRRGFLTRIGVLFNVVAGAVLAVPILRYVLSPAIRGQKRAYEGWVSLGSVGLFPEGETRLAVYRSPAATPTDGDTAKVSCWVRRVSADTFQVFAVNCAHLGCPVRWFPQSNLFMCPCHGGAYYADGARASGPPERGLFEYAWKIESGQLHLKTGEMPTPGLTSLGIRRSRWT